MPQEVNESKMLSLGEKRVKVDFNVTGNSQVDYVKTRAAHLINEAENTRGGKDCYGKANDIPVGSGEKQRLISLAQTAFEDGAMWLVKAIHTD